MKPLDEPQDNTEKSGDADDTSTVNGGAPAPEPTDDPGEGLPRPDRLRSVYRQLHRGAILFFAVFGAYLLSIYLDLWVNMGFTLLLDRMPLFFMKYVAVPVALEAGLGLSGLVILYLLGRFVELAVWPTLISFWLGVHLVDMLMKWLLGQFEYGYGEPRVLLLRLPGLLLFSLCSYFVFRAALKRGNG